MLMRYEKGNVCDALDDTCYLVHCISADFKLGAGVALEITRRFLYVRHQLDNMKSKPWFEYTVPNIIFTGNIINLVTKKYYNDKPTKDDFTIALVRLRTECDLRGIRKLIMPKIGCGLDMLSWKLFVEPRIKRIFADTDIEIVIYTL